ncbi:hypothetical protein BgiMline_032654 [Biomphalaria glabrata]|nr:hypothetical protein BgiMline_015667 [Biomphalaria glabrata]
MLVFVIVLCLSVFSEAVPCSNGSLMCKALFRDSLSIEPAGCDQNSLWTTPSWSKPSCAVTCMFRETCVAFTFSSATNECVLCQGDQMQNLTFNSDNVYFWNFQIVRTNLYIINQWFFPVTNGMYPGFVVHLSGNFFGYNSSYFAIRLSQDGNLASNTIPFVVRVYKDKVFLLYVQNLVWITIKVVSLPVGVIEVNTTTTVDVLMTKDGYQNRFNEKLTAPVKQKICGQGKLDIKYTNPFLSDEDLVAPQDGIAYFTRLLHEYFTKLGSVNTCFAALERCLCVALPMIAKRVINSKVAVVVNVALFVLLFCLCAMFSHNCISYLDWKLIPICNKTTLFLCYERNRERGITVPCYVTDLSLPYGYVLMLLFCAMIFSVTLRSKSKWRQSITNSRDKLTEVTYKEKKTTKLLLCVTLLLPHSILYTAVGSSRAGHRCRLPDHLLDSFESWI